MLTENCVPLACFDASFFIKRTVILYFNLWRYVKRRERLVDQITGLRKFSANDCKKDQKPAPSHMVLSNRFGAARTKVPQELWAAIGQKGAFIWGTLMVL
jgi:hypothetical protein